MITYFNAKYVFTVAKKQWLQCQCIKFQAIWIFSIVDYKPVTYNKAIGGEYFYPDWAIALGWCITATSFIPIPLLAIYNIYKAKADGIWNVSTDIELSNL